MVLSFSNPVALLEMRVAFCPVLPVIGIAGDDSGLLSCTGTVPVIIGIAGDEDGLLSCPTCHNWHCWR